MSVLDIALPTLQFLPYVQILFRYGHHHYLFLATPPLDYGIALVKPFTRSLADFNCELVKGPVLYRALVQCSLFRLGGKAGRGI